MFVRCLVEILARKKGSTNQDVDPRGGEKAEEEKPAARDAEEGQAEGKEAETEDHASRLGRGGGSGGAWRQEGVDARALVGPLGEFLWWREWRSEETRKERVEERRREGGEAGAGREERLGQTDLHCDERRQLGRRQTGWRVG